MLAVGIFCAANAVPADAQTPKQTPPPDPNFVSTTFNEIESKYIFGFTDGSDIGNQGEKAIEFETTGSFKKRGGKYSAIEQELEFESVPSQFFAYELSAHGMSHSIKNVEGLDNLNSTAFSGLSAKLRYLLIERGPGSPIGVTIRPSRNGPGSTARTARRRAIMRRNSALLPTPNSFLIVSMRRSI